MSTPPKLFLSYSWSSPTHEAWVEELAERLTDDGVHVIFDKWDLKEGHDTNAYMEQIVTNDEVKKVAIIFDKEYVRRADEREKGVGTETRLITSEIYKKSSQDKFVAVIAERDETGAPYVPAYYSGRIHIDMTDTLRVDSEYDRLIRWIYDRPEKVRPPIGKAPSFLDETPTQRFGNSSALKRVLVHLIDGKQTAAIFLDDYLKSVADTLEAMRIQKVADIEFDEQVADSIEAFTPTRNDLVSVFHAVARLMPSEENVEKISHFFEKLAEYFYPPENAYSYSDWDSDNFKFITEELFLYCVAAFLDAERFEQARLLIHGDLYVEAARRHGQDPILPVTALNQNIPSLEHRGRRLKMASASIHADLLHDRAKLTAVPFMSLAQADMVLYLAHYKSSPTWWPFTSVFLTMGRAILPIFARARSARYFAKMSPVIDGDTVASFKERLAEIASRDAAPRWDYRRVPISLLVGAEMLGTRP